MWIGKSVMKIGFDVWEVCIDTNGELFEKI